MLRTWMAVGLALLTPGLGPSASATPFTCLIEPERDDTQDCIDSSLAQVRESALLIENGYALDLANVVEWTLDVFGPPVTSGAEDEGGLVTFKCPSTFAKFQSAYRIYNIDDQAISYQDMVTYQDTCVEKAECYIEEGIMVGTIVFLGQTYPASNCGWSVNTGCTWGCAVTADVWVHACLVEPIWSTEILGVDAIPILTLTANYESKLDATCILDVPDSADPEEA